MKPMLMGLLVAATASAATLETAAKSLARSPVLPSTKRVEILEGPKSASSSVVVATMR